MSQRVTPINCKWGEGWWRCTQGWWMSRGVNVSETKRVLVLLCSSRSSVLNAAIVFWLLGGEVKWMRAIDAVVRRLERFLCDRYTNCTHAGRATLVCPSHLVLYLWNSSMNFGKNLFFWWSALRLAILQIGFICGMAPYNLLKVYQTSERICCIRFHRRKHRDLGVVTRRALNVQILCSVASF